MIEIQAIETQLAALDLVPMGVFALREDLTVIYWNDYLQTWSRISRSEIVGKRIDERFPHFNQQDILDRLGMVFDAGTPIIS